MKKLLLIAAGLSFAASVFAQGTIVFNNRLTGSLVTHVYYNPAVNSSVIGNGANDTPAGTTSWAGYTALDGSGFMATLRCASGAGVDPTLLQWAGATTTFRSGAGAGFINGTTLTLPNVAKDAAAATFQMFAWDNRSGNYGTAAAAFSAWQAGTIAAGFSNPFNVTKIGGDFNTPPNMDGLQSFNIYTVPEPSSLALAGLGAAAMLIFRRRK
ncbi:MAG TPA: PEP-CTERM sorting domain-containing protein [Clostridia bacterium]|nr:PEP-CTERM sorting domain-containing protein [Clostridia bacterium]